MLLFQSLPNKDLCGPVLTPALLYIVFVLKPVPIWTIMDAALPKIGQTDKALQTCLLLVESSSATNNIVGFEACLRTRFEVSFQTRFEAVAQTGPVGAPCFKPGLKAGFKPLGLPVR